MKPVIVVTRSPEAETEVEVFGVAAQVINIDLGRGFDIDSPRPADAPEAREYAEMLAHEIEDLEPDHPARESVQQAIDRIEEEYAEYPEWGADRYA